MKFELATILLATSGLVSAIAIAEPAAEPAANPGFRNYKGKFTFCGVRGMACSRVKRSAEAVAEAFADPDAGFRNYKGKFGFCGARGMACHKARSAVDEIGEIAERSMNDMNSYESIVARDAEPGFRNYQGKFGFCGVRGMACKRSAEAFPEPKIHIHRKYPNYKGLFTFCGPRGAACLGKRDAVSEETEVVARAIHELDPELLKRQCLADGECAGLLKARAAFQQIKREAEEVHADAGVQAAKETPEGEACYAEDGPCTKAEAYLDELEAALEKGVASIDE